MVILRIMLGILMIVCACYVLAMPALSSVALCWIISFFMLITGIVTIIRYIENKNAERVAESIGIPHLKTGVGSLLFGIAAVIVSVLARNSVIGEAVFVQIISTLFGLWIVLEGISMLILGSGLKKIAAPGWLVIMIMGAFLTVSGIVCIVDCFTGLTAMGVMFGISMMMSGFAFLFS